MRKRGAVLCVIAALLSLGVGKPVAADQIECAVAAVTSPASEAFDAFCARCHKAQELAGTYFADLAAEEATRREAELAAFLDRHSACPHRHHEEIAAWLRELADAR